MKSIVLEVDDELAVAWKNGSPSSRAVYEDRINAVLKEFKEIEEATETRLTEEELDIIAEDVTEGPYEWWNDKEMVAELDQISADMDSGKDKGASWEEIKEGLLKRPR